MIARWLLAALIAVDVAYAKPVQAQDYPSKPIRIMVGFAAGGIADLGARLLADHIARETGQQAVVEGPAPPAWLPSRVPRLMATQSA